MNPGKANKPLQFTEYDSGKVEDSTSWKDTGETEATVINIKASREGIPKWEDDDMCYHFWTYDYQVPDSGEIRTYTGIVQFVASAYGEWFRKYPKGFKFNVRYNKSNPSQHIRLHNFD